MPLCYSNFKSFRNKSSRIFLFEQLLFSKVNKLTCKGQVGLGLDGKGWWRANTGCNQLSDAIGHSHATSIKIEGCPCKLWQPYCTEIISDTIGQTYIFGHSLSFFYQQFNYLDSFGKLWDFWQFSNILLHWVLFLDLFMDLYFGLHPASGSM